MRLLDIIFYLLRSSSKVTIKELARKYNVSTRTIQRDLDKLSILGIPIIINRGKNGGVEIDNGYVIRRQMLRYNDYEELIFALYICENISKNMGKTFLIDKFKCIDESKFFETLDKLKERFIVDLYEEKFDTQSNICKAIDKALDNKSFIEIETKDDKRTIFPISYVLRKEGLCLYYWSDDYNLILINDIYNVNVINRSYNDNIISYRENKKINLI
ncbi:HTH domain-containing protein [Clostridioides difficile]